MAEQTPRTPAHSPDWIDGETFGPSRCATYRPASRNSRLTASALSASDRGNPAIIIKAAAKPSEPVEPAPGSEPLK